MFDFGKAEDTALEDLTLSDKVYLGTSAMENLLEYMSQDELMSLLEVFDGAVHEKIERLPKQIDASDVPDVLRMLHALKGSTSYLKADRFLELLLETDRVLRVQTDIAVIQSVYDVFYREFTLFVSEVRYLRRYIEQHFDQLF